MLNTVWKGNAAFLHLEIDGSISVRRPVLHGQSFVLLRQGSCDTSNRPVSAFQALLVAALQPEDGPRLRFSDSTARRQQVLMLRVSSSPRSHLLPTFLSFFLTSPQRQGHESLLSHI